MPQEQHEVSMDRRMSRLSRRFDPDNPRPAIPRRPAEPPRAAAVPEPIGEVREHTPGEPMTLSDVRTWVAVDPASGDADNAVVVYGTVDGFGRIVNLTVVPPRQAPDETVDRMSVREPEKATTIVINDPPPGADPLQVGLAAMRARQAQGVPRRPR